MTIKVEKTSAPYGAAFAPAPSAGSAWFNIQLIGLVETRNMTAPVAAGTLFTFVITLNFIPDATGAFPAGDQYNITITGAVSGVFREPLPPTPAEGAVIARAYNFTT